MFSFSPFNQKNPRRWGIFSLLFSCPCFQQRAKSFSLLIAPRFQSLFTAPDLPEEEERNIRAHFPPNSPILEPHQPPFTEPNATSALFVGFSSSECIWTGEGERGVTVPHCNRMGNALCGVGAAPRAAEPQKLLVVPLIWPCSSVCLLGDSIFTPRRSHEGDENPQTCAAKPPKCKRKARDGDQI